MSTSFVRRNRPLGTWVTEAEQALFMAICARHNVTPAAYLRAMVIDCLAEEGGAITTALPQRKDAPDLFSAP